MPARGHDIVRVGELAAKGMAAMSRVLEGKADALTLTWTVILAEGHLLLEDVPGVGKTLLAKALGRAIGSEVRRIQFTPDLLPSDVVGVNVFNQETRRFEFRRGPVFANIVIGDEVNRASPKTQSALLECMAENQASVDGVTYPLPHPFMVIATQNPVDMEGTYALPEAQRDRFMAKLSLGYPSAAAEIDLLGSHTTHDPLEELVSVCTAEELEEAIRTVRSVTATETLRGYIVRLLDATRDPSAFSLGASPRAGLHLLRAAKAAAALAGRDYVLPDDIKPLVLPVLAHRLIPTTEATEDAETILAGILETVPVDGPSPNGRRSPPGARRYSGRSASQER